MKNFDCPVCNKPILEHNEKDENGFVIKSRLVFLDDKGHVLCKCFQCKNVVPLPLLMKSSEPEQK